MFIRRRFSLTWASFTPPANDAYASATALTLPATITNATIKDATLQATEVIGDAYYDQEQSIWYKFTPATTGRYRIGTPVSSITYEGTYSIPQTYVLRRIGTSTGVNNFTTLADDGMSGAAGTISYDRYLDLTAGTEYYIRFSGGYKQKGGASNEGFNSRAAEFDLTVELSVAPSNDNFASPTVLSTTLPASLTAQTNKGATKEATEVNSSSYDEQSTWYSFTPTVTGWYRFRTPSGFPGL